MSARTRRGRAPRAGARLPMTAALAAALLLPVGCDGLYRRGGLGVAPARAQESVPAAILNPIAPGPAAPARLSAQDGTSPGAPALLPDPTRFSPGEIELLQRLGERREALDARERQLELRAAALAMAEARLREQIARLEALRVALEAQLQNRAAVEEARLQSLIKIYERMRPKDAAAIFDRLEMPVLLAVVEGMREAKSAPVIAAMDPAKAERLTTELARRRNLPTSGG